MSCPPDFGRQLVVMRDRYICQRCGLQGADWHHRRSRKVKDAHTHDPCNGILLCRKCHQWCHDHPFLARARGLIVSKYTDDPGSVPVWTVLGLVKFDCDGGYTWVKPEM